jgi:hypothetical protein
VILTKLAALALILAMMAIGIFVVRRNLRGEHTFRALGDLGLAPPIKFELMGNSLFLATCGFFLLLVIASFFQGS